MTRTSSCLECGASVSLIDGIPMVRDTRVGLRCRVCPEPAPAPAPAPEPEPEAAPAPAPEAAPAPAPEARRFGKSRLMGAAVVLVALAMVGLQAVADPLSPPPLATAGEVDAAERLAWVSIPAPEPPRVHALTYALTDEQVELPWVHPIAVERALPTKADRRFGAQRPGTRPAECGGGHCGVDLGDHRGVIIHAVLGGRVIRVKRAAGGASGRYVAIEHPHGLRSSYMHLDRIHPDLVEGVDIASGEAIGMLGSTGIKHSPPHLHFTVERRSDSGWQYVDPEPMLTQATVLDAPAPLPAPPAKLSLDLSAAGELPTPPARDSGSKKAASEDITE